jgi:large subunit ribosomal protein L10
MNRAQKENIVASLQAELQDAPLVAFVDYRGITVEQVDEIRRSLESKGIQYRVVKNTLIRRAVSGTEKECIAPSNEDGKADIGKDPGLAKGMSALLISGEDGVEAAKTINEISKGFKNKSGFIVKGGYFDGDALDAKGIQKVADYLSKDELFSLLLRTVQETPRQVLGVIQAPARDLVYLLRNLENKLSEDGE